MEAGAEEDVDYIIERISAQRKVGSRNEYLVHWEGFEEPSWEPTKGVSNTEAMQAWKARPKE